MKIVENEIRWTGHDGATRKLVWDDSTEKWRAFKCPVASWLQRSFDDDDFMVLEKIFGKKSRRELRVTRPDEVDQA